MLHAVKMIADGDAYIIEGLAAPFGGPLNGKDLQREFFSAKTDFALDWFPERPLLFEHGFDEGTQIEPVGRVIEWEIKSDLGLWVRAQLDKSSKYWEGIKELVEAGTLYFSSTALAHLVTKNKSTGELIRWPWCELSLTSHPCNPLAEIATVTKHYEAAGIKSTRLDELKSAMSAAQRNRLPDSDFAYIDSDGNRHLPINDEAHVRAALSRFSQTQFESPTARMAARRKITARAKRLGIDVSDATGKSWSLAFLGAEPCDGECCEAYKALPDEPTLMSDDDGGPYPEGSYEDLAEDIAQALRVQTGNYAYVVATFPTYALVRCCGDDDATSADDYSMPEMSYYRVAYYLNADGEPVLGEMQQVEPAMIPVKAALPIPQTDEAPLAMQAGRLSDYAALVADHTKGVHDRRTKEGRTLSVANTERLNAAADALETTLKSLRELIAVTPEPQTAKAASEDRPTTSDRGRFLALTTRLRSHQVA